MTTSHRNARLLILAPVSLSVDRVELLRSMGFAGTGGGNGEAERARATPDALYGEDNAGILPYRL